ncbi:pyrroline-5-carboxylate reductase [Pseudomonadota bacterium]
MDTLKIGFIGGGNMARSIIGGLIADGRNPNTIWVSDASQDQLDHLKQIFNINVTTNNDAVAKATDVVVMAVKPQIMKIVAEEISCTVQDEQPLIMSIAAGIMENSLNKWLGGNVAIVRTMPNTPSLVQTGATALYANTLVSNEQQNIAETIMRAVGLTLWIEEEKQMDAVTAVSGSGPAYFFLFMEAMEEAAIKLGLSDKAAQLLTLQTAFGAAKMALESQESCATLRQRVTSPGGTTEQALNTFEEGKLRILVEDALKAAANRSAELAQQMGE